MHKFRLIQESRHVSQPNFWKCDDCGCEKTLLNYAGAVPSFKLLGETFIEDEPECVYTTNRQRAESNWPPYVIEPTLIRTGPISVYEKPLSDVWKKKVSVSAIVADGLCDGSNIDVALESTSGECKHPKEDCMTQQGTGRIGCKLCNSWLS